MKAAKQVKQSGRRPVGKGRNERAERRSRSMVPNPEKAEAGYVNTGVFSGVARPESVGVSDAVRIATRQMARRAKRAEIAWLKTLPKGVTV